MKTESKIKLLLISIIAFITCSAVFVRCIGIDIWNNEKIYVIGNIILLLGLCIFVMQDKLEWNIQNTTIFSCVWTISIVLITLFGLADINEWIPYYVPVIIITVMYGIDSGACLNLFECAYLGIIWHFEDKVYSPANIIKLLTIGMIIIISTKYMKNLTQIIFTGMSVLFATGIVNILYYNLIWDRVDFKSLVIGFLIIGLTYLVGFVVVIWKKINYKEQVSSYEIADELCSEKFEAIKEYKEKLEQSYVHAVNVSELACMAANKIDLDIGVIRVGSIYHEIGKSVNPSDYVNEGLLICDKYELPDYVKNIIIEHCLKIRNPRSIESAIVMLSDSIINSIEYSKANNQVIDNKKIIENVLKVRFESGSLDECNMTIVQFNKIKEAFLNAYKE